MSYLKHKVYGFLFNIFKYTEIKKNKISFITDSKESFNSNFTYIEKEFEKRGDFEFNIFYKDELSLKNFRNLSDSKYIFLNDNFFPLAFMKFNPDSIVTQLWHAPGASKKFGGTVDIESRPVLKKISDNTDYLIVTSKNIIDYYCEAFQISKSKIKAFGLPRLDYYFENHDVAELKEKFLTKHNISSDKKIILYAPTFREDNKYNNVFNYFDLDEFNRVLGDDYVLALRLHPKIKNFYSNEISSDNLYIDVSDFENEQELMLISDILITDYSSIMIEYAVLDRPIIFFTYDLDNYLTHERGFYYDFKTSVPGNIVFNTSQLIDVIRNNEFDTGRLQSFLNTQFDEIDGRASGRIVEFMLNNEVENE